MQTCTRDVTFAPLTRSHLILQDGQEFFKLLLSLLEAQLARSSQEVCLPASHALCAAPAAPCSTSQPLRHLFSTAFSHLLHNSMDS